MDRLEYLDTLIYINVCFFLILILYFIGYLLNKNTKQNAFKLSNYETGCLTSSDNSYLPIFQFYLIGIIFLILDVEIILMFP